MRMHGVEGDRDRSREAYRLGEALPIGIVGHKSGVGGFVSFSFSIIGVRV